MAAPSIFGIDEIGTAGGGSAGELPDAAAGAALASGCDAACSRLHPAEPPTMPAIVTVSATRERMDIFALYGSLTIPARHGRPRAGAVETAARIASGGAAVDP